MTPKRWFRWVGPVLAVLMISATTLGGRAAAAPPGSVPTLAGDVPIVGDWDGNGNDGIGVYRDGTWLLKNALVAGGVDSGFAWGRPGDVPVVGDWDGDGRDGIGVFRNGAWYLRQTPRDGGIDVQFAWGVYGDVPIVGDWDGDGRDGIGVFRDGTWYLRQTATAGPADLTFTWGSPTDLPTAGDWDGDRRSGIGVLRGGQWLLRATASGGPVDVAVAWGSPGDLPVPGDWDGNGSDTFGVRRGASWLLRNHISSGPIEAQFPWGQPAVVTSANQGPGPRLFPQVPRAGDTGNSQSRLTIYNDTPYPLRLGLIGPESHSLAIIASPTSTVYTTRPTGCRTDVPSQTIDLAPGVYSITGSLLGISADYVGVWSFEAGALYGCSVFLVQR